MNYADISQNSQNRRPSGYDTPYTSSKGGSLYNYQLFSTPPLIDEFKSSGTLSQATSHQGQGSYDNPFNSLPITQQNTHSVAQRQIPTNPLYHSTSSRHSSRSASEENFNQNNRFYNTHLNQGSTSQKARAIAQREMPANPSSPPKEFKSPSSSTFRTFNQDAHNNHPARNTRTTRVWSAPVDQFRSRHSFSSTARDSPDSHNARLIARQQRHTATDVTVGSQVFSSEKHPLNLSLRSSPEADPSTIKSVEELNKQLLIQSKARNYGEVVKLIRQGANLNITNEHGETPLHIAALQGDLHTMRVLLKNEADKYALTLAGKTPMTYAIEGDSLQAVRILVEYGKYNAPLRIPQARPIYTKPIITADGKKDHSQSGLIDISQKSDQEALVFNIVMKLLENEIFEGIRLLKPSEQEGKQESVEVRVPKKKAIEILIKAGANTEAMLKLVNDGFRQDENLKTNNVIIWPYYGPSEKILLRAMSDEYLSYYGISKPKRRWKSSSES